MHTRTIITTFEKRRIGHEINTHCQSNHASFRFPVVQFIVAIKIAILEGPQEQQYSTPHKSTAQMRRTSSFIQVQNEKH